MELSIDTAADDAGIAVSIEGVVERAATWTTHQNQSAELLPRIERLLAENERTKREIRAVFVDVGPGSYAGLRVGVSTAKALAHGLGIPIAGAGRLALDAAGVARDVPAGARVIAVHRAGRGELAFAAYRNADGGCHEEIAPRIRTAATAYETISAGDVVTGDVDDELAREVAERGANIAPPRAHRVVALAEHCYARLAAGASDDPASLVPLYLRGPAIGPQQAR